MKLVLIAAAVCIGLVSECRAQTPVDSIWNLVSPKTVRSMKVVPIDGLASVTALQQDVSFSLLQTSITVNFPAAIAPYTFSGIRLTVSAAGPGFIEEQPYIFRIPQPPVAVAVGQTASVTYFAPLTSDGSIGPVVLGPLPPPPPPPPPPTTSPDGTRMPPATSITFPAGVVWTKGAPDADGVALGQISAFRNGVKVKGSVTYITRVGTDIFNCDPLPPKGSGAGYERWNGTGWTLVSSTCP